MAGGIKSSQIRDDSVQSIDIKNYTIINEDIAENANIDVAKIDTPWRKAVDNYSDLPLTGNIDGEIKLVSNRLELYRWNSSSSEWEQITFSGSISNNIVEYHTASSGQTVFNLNNSYKPGANDLLVFQNGILQKNNDDYTETNDSTVTFSKTVNNGDIITFIIGKANNNFFGEIESFTATSGQKVFNLSFSYNTGNDEIDVFKNGLLMLKGTSNDYQETSSSQITFNYELSTGDVVVVRKARDYTKTGGSINKLDDLNNLTESIIPTDSTGYSVSLGNDTNLFSNIYTENLYVENYSDHKVNFAYSDAGGAVETTTSTSYISINNLSTISINVKTNDVIKVTLQGWFWNTDSSYDTIAYPTIYSGDASLLVASYIRNDSISRQMYCERIYKANQDGTISFEAKWRANGGGTASCKYISLTAQVLGHS